MKDKVRVGTRRSELALIQTRWVVSELELAGLSPELIEIESEGDQDRTTPLYAFAGQGKDGSIGLFTKSLESALLDGRIDLAVHSLKDLPTIQPDGLRVWAIPKREDPRDCLVTKSSQGLLWDRLSAGALVGTSSLRREALCLAARPDAQVVPLRGNVPTRLNAVRDGKVAATVLAMAGLIRLGLDKSELSIEPLDPFHWVPAPGQGALAIEGRVDLKLNVIEVLRKLQDDETALCVMVERKILRALEGGCSLPLGVLVTRDRSSTRIAAFLGKYATGPEPKAIRRWLFSKSFDKRGDNIDNLVEAVLTAFQKEEHA